MSDINFNAYHKTKTTWDKRPPKPDKEDCCICDEPTGRSGVGEGSICRVMNHNVHFSRVGFLEKDQELIGLCGECFDVIEIFSEEL